ncbi:hypothetical protein SDJN02_27467, partial [Cucurbita argyrosperma subsp. argyrosperma]
MTRATWKGRELQWLVDSMPEEINDGTRLKSEKDDREILHKDEEHGKNQFTDARILIFNGLSKL